MRVKAEPRTRRAADPPVGEEFVEDRLQKIDRYHHVERDDPPARGLMLQLERADPEQVAPRTDQGGAAPIRMGGRREKRLVEEVFPYPANSCRATIRAARERERPPAPPTTIS